MRTTAFFAMLLLVGTNAFAQPGGRGGGARGGGMMGGGMGGRGIGNGAGMQGAFPPEMVEAQAAAFEIDEPTLAKVRKINQDARLEQAQLQSELTAANASLQQLFNKPKVNIDELTKQVKVVGDIETKTRVSRMAQMVRVREVLSPKQLKKIEDYMNEMRQNGGPGGQMGGQMGGGPGGGRMGGGRMGGGGMGGGMGGMGGGGRGRMGGGGPGQRGRAQ
jgi:hypothetical protein